MAEPDLTIIYLVLGALAILCIGFFGGRFGDLNWRCTIYRRFTKKNWAVLNTLDKSGRLIMQSLTEHDDGLASKGNAKWLVPKQSVYEAMQGNPSEGKDKKGPSVYFRSGAPNIFVNYDSRLPLAIMDPYNESYTKVKPFEFGGWLEGWTNNQVQKRTISKDILKILLYIVIVGLVINLVMTFISNNTAGEAVKACKGISVPAPSPTNTQPGKVVNGSLVIPAPSSSG